MATKEPRAPSIALLPGQTAARARVLAVAQGIAGWIETRFEAERAQLPLWLPVGLGGGIAGWSVLADPPAWAAFALLCAAVACAALAGAGETRAGRALALFAAAAAIGCALIWWRAEAVAAPRLERPLVAEFTGRIESVETLAARDSVRLTLAEISAPRVPPKVRITVAQDDADPRLAPGVQVAVRARLMPPAPMAVPGAYDFARVAWFKGLGAAGRALDPPRIVAVPDRPGWRDRLADARRRLSAHIRAQLAPGEGGVAASLVTGDQGGVPEADAEALRRSGLAHLLSISGLHVAAVVGGTMLLVLKLLALSRRLALHWPLVLIAAAAGAITGVAYTLFSGAEVPTVRACIAALLVLAGIAIGREAITLRLVAVGALVVLLLWPEALAGPSFQLSFAAVTAIVALHEHPRIKALLSRREEGLAQRLGRGLLGLLLTGIAVEFALSPIALYHFHQAGLYGALANIVAIPLTTFAVMPCEAAALLFDLVGLGAPFWWLTGQALSLLLWIAHATAAAPGSVAMLPAMPDGAFALMVAGGLWLALWRTRWRRWGLVPAVVGAAWALATPPADLIITGDGRHLALRDPAGGAAILRDRAGDYVRDLLSESTGVDGELGAIEALPAARCSADLCRVEIVRDGRRWRLLATRSAHLVPIEAMNRACAEADIVVADRRLPRTCTPRWLKADRPFLAQTGGLAITLGERPHVATVAERVGRHPWAGSK